MTAAAQMPRGNLPNFTAVYEQDYLTSFPRGDGTGRGVEDVYPGHQAYDGFPDTSHAGLYDKSNRTLWAADSALAIHCHTDPATGRILVAYVAPGGYDHNQRYGKWTWRLAAPAGPAVEGFKVVVPFWPGSDRFGDGEWDIGENVVGSDSDLQFNLHTATVAAAMHGNGTTLAGKNIANWHVYDVEWTPARALITVDGFLARTVTSNSIAWPKNTLRFGVQAEVADTRIGCIPPRPAATGTVYVDWVKQYAYTPGTVGGGT